MRPFDVQLIGGMVLHEGKIAEMRTGEGKTLVATLPVYLNALAGKGVHVVTVNEYLAQRDADWMGPIYRLLGLTVGVITSGQPPAEKRAAYACDVTYGTNNEFGFDYLRDNLAARLEDRVQRGQPFAIVDEVDSILIDEARTPLIISGPAEESTELYAEDQRARAALQAPGQPRRARATTSPTRSRSQVHLSEAGFEKAEELMQEAGLLREGESLYDPANIRLMHHLNAALRAHVLYQRDVEYIVRDGEVIIVDEFTGRTMPGRRWSDGLHQAVEAKEGVRIHEENQTVASITFQNYFRLYEKLAGMTGTADTEAFEFQQIYGLEVVVDPDAHADGPQGHAGPRLPDAEGQVRRDHRGHQRLRDARPAGARRHDVDRDVGDSCRACSRRADIAHQVLNAKQHEREARSSRRPAAPAPSRSRPTWPAAAPTSCSAATSRPGRPAAQGRRDERGAARRPRARARERLDRAAREGDRGRAACTSSAPSGTSRGASTISFAAVRAARAIPAPAGSICRSKTT